MSSRLDELLTRIPALKVCAPDILLAYDMILSAFLKGRKLLLCGNGGSAADAEHWAGELLKGFMHPRQLPEHAARGLPDLLRKHLQWALPAIPLTGFNALATAFSNDVEPSVLFAQLVWGLGNEGDVLAALSTSGNSVNVCLAAEAARAKGIRVLALTGQAGGKLKPLADVCIAAPATLTPLIQEFHLPIYHCLSLMLEDAWAEKILADVREKKGTEANGA